jgi:hypothetical protein
VSPSTLGIIASGVTSSAFSPLDLSPALWLDASDTATITASSGAVSQWDDKSGNARHAVQATGSLQPTTGADTQNSLNVLTFAADLMTSSHGADVWKFMHDGTDYIIAAVARFTVDTSGGLLGNSSGNQHGFYVLYNTYIPLRLEHSVTQTGAVYTSINQANSFITASAMNIYTVLADPDNGTAADRSRMFRNAGTVGANNTETRAASTASPTNAALTIGGYANTAAMTGRIGELIIVSGANATETNRAALRDYLNTKWAVY